MGMMIVLSILAYGVAAFLAVITVDRLTRRKECKHKPYRIREDGFARCVICGEEYCVQMNKYS